MSIGPYRIIEALGRGANGEVYLAEDLRLGRKVAIKTLVAPDSKALTGARRSVLREARAAARLNHPHIAGVYDVVESPEGAHIVMEYVRGETLAARLRAGPLPPGQVLEIAIQLAGALAEAHAMGVVHRDLKPGNVVITPKGDVKILDFGLAQVRAVEAGSTPVESSRDFTISGEQIGTPPYMPPEHLLGDPVDARGDLYSLGVMLYELLTGLRPFRGPDAMKLVMAILTEPTPRARGSNPAIPDALDAIVFRAMSRLPQQRYASAVEMAADLRRAAAGISPGVVANEWVSDVLTPTRPDVSPVGLGRKGRAASLLGMVAIVGLAVYAVVSRGRTPAATQAVGPPVVAVLPLAGEGADAASVATGVADSLISGLSRVPGLTVVSRAATLPYHDRKKSTETVARELGATAVVDGTVQHVAQKVRVTLALLNPGSNRVAWSNSYDGTPAEILTIQSQAAQELADALRVGLSPQERSRIQKSPTQNLEAYADYVQARTFLDRPDVKGNVDRSIDLLRSAIGRDPKFARAFAGLGEAYWRKFLDTRDSSWPIKARDSTAEALRLDPDDATVRYALAILYWDTGRSREAVEEFRRALELQPTNDDARRRLGQALAEGGQQAAGLAELQAAIRLRPSFWRNHFALGLAELRAGRYAQAVSAFRRVTELQPDNAWGFQMLGTAHHAAGARKEAVANYLRAIELGPDARAYSNLGTAYYEEGRFEEAARAYEQAARLEPKVPAKHRNLGDVYNRLGQPDRAKDAYRRAIALGHDQLQTNPRDGVTLALIAVCEAKLGNASVASRHIAEALAFSPTSGDVLYRKAVVHALSGQPEQSLIALRAALEHGYSPASARTDDDLTTLRGNPHYEKLVGAVNRTN
jgi:tetratricopeptide (TPR) repeat protein/tRNA A-37 threonylcarbamoyl transferase component Bud32